MKKNNIDQGGKRGSKTNYYRRDLEAGSVGGGAKS
jgi:hypothetical protein